MRFCQRREKQVLLLRLNKIFEFPSCWITLKLYTKYNWTTRLKIQHLRSICNKNRKNISSDSLTNIEWTIEATSTNACERFKSTRSVTRAFQRAVMRIAERRISPRNFAPRNLRRHRAGFHQRRRYTRVYVNLMFQTQMLARETWKNDRIAAGEKWKHNLSHLIIPPF